MQRSALCRSRQELSNADLLAKSGFDTAENEPSKVGRTVAKLVAAEVQAHERAKAALIEALVERVDLVGWKQLQITARGP